MLVLDSRAFQLAKGFVSLLAVIILWAGIWILCDRHIPAGRFSTLKELILILCGIVVMIFADVFFISAFMDRFSKLKQISQIDAADKTKKEKLLSYLHFYSKSIMGMIGIVIFWNGAFNLMNKATKGFHYQFVIHFVALLCGSIVVLYTIQAEDQYVLELKEGAREETRKYTARGEMYWAYIGAFSCNFSQVLLWWGVETYAEMHMNGKPLFAAALFIGGLVMLKLLNKLESNLGLEAESKEDPYGIRSNVLVRFFLNTCELISVVLVWTGFQWFFWGDFLLKETALRDAIYVVVGFMIVTLSGRLVSLMGVISPVGVYGEIHANLGHGDDHMFDAHRFVNDYDSKHHLFELLLNREI